MDQRAYLRNALPLHVVRVPEVRRIVGQLLREGAPTERGLWEATVRELWDGASHREERYAALVLARDRSARRWQDPAVVGLYRHLVVTGAWWDLIDEIATRLEATRHLG